MTRRLALYGLAALTLIGSLGCRLIAPKPIEYTVRSLPSGVVTQDLVIPIEKGRPYARTGDRLTLHYTAYLDDGSVVDSSLDVGVPVTCILGEETLPRGLEQGLLGMRFGAERRVVVPPKLAYGVEGVIGLVPPNATVTFVVSLIGLERPEAPPEEEA
ncbi:MAG: FKBP-type peptidyl-prolyl cis-trans isomerase [Planctomycetota bacterium]